MSWRVAAAVMIAIAAALLISATTADPLRTATDSIEEADPPGGRFDLGQYVDKGLRAYGNMILIIVFGLMGWGIWRVLRREATRGGGL